MSFNRARAAVPIMFVLISGLLHPAFGASSQISSDGWDVYAQTVAMVDAGRMDEARRVLAAADPGKIRRLPPVYRDRILFLNAWLSPPKSFSGPSIRKINRYAGNLGDLLFWKGMVRGGFSSTKMAGLRKKFAEMYPSSPLYHGLGRESRTSARAIWQKSMDASSDGDGDLARSYWKTLVAKHPLSPESGLAALRLSPEHLGGGVLIPRWMTLSSMGMGSEVLRETKAYLSRERPFPYRDEAYLLRAQELGKAGRAEEGKSLLESALGEKGIKLSAPLEAERCLLSARPRNEYSCIHGFLEKFPASVTGRKLAILALRDDILKPFSAQDPLWKTPSGLLWTPEGQDALWLYGLDSYFRGDKETALGRWKELADFYGETGDPSGVRVGRVDYFMGRTYGMLGNGQEAMKWYRRAIKNAPDSVYAVWAGISCGEQCHPVELKLHRARMADPQLSRSNRSRLLRLVQMGLWGPAWGLYLLSQDTTRIGLRIVRYGAFDMSVTPEVRLRLVRALSGGDPETVRIAAGESIHTQILEGIRQSGVDRNWALSIARQESRFDAEALSIDGAIGVMQLMPHTAVAAAKTDPGGLYRLLEKNLGVVRNPFINSYLGSRYLGRLMEAYPHNPERAVASYNAGMHMVVRWKRLASEDWDFFVEGIPFKETRRYDREVLWNYMYIHSHHRELGG
jgi:soluble lytic murein transglycosylase